MEKHKSANVCLSPDSYHIVPITSFHFLAYKKQHMVEKDWQNIYTHSTTMSLASLLKSKQQQIQRLESGASSAPN
jgi:hypothetical protein